MVIELCKLLNEVTTKTVPTENGDKIVLNNRVMIYQGKNKSTFVDITAWNGMAEFTINEKSLAIFSVSWM